MKKFKAIVSLFIIMVGGSMVINAQVKDAELQKMIDSRSFIFKARTVFPQSSSSRLLTSDYDLKINNGKVVSFLPYFGRAFSVTPADEGGIKFTSSDFNYTTKKTKRGWRITIVPKDATGVQQLELDVSSKGYANLQVNSTNRQNISFYGVIEKTK